MNPDIKAINEKIIKESEFVEKIIKEMGKVIVGQTYMIERLIIGLLSNGQPTFFESATLANARARLEST